MKVYKISDQARDDLKDIRDYLWEQVGRRVAARELRNIRDGIVLITEHPGIGHRRLDLSDDQTRFYLVGRYLVIYKVDKACLNISRILHSARDVKKILGE